ncbi:Fic family protein [Gordonia sp. HNM0687]|uniref:Fic family protein n=1 Tax=Gordonia mangrovi TaxID=2665643 RepID=A0A6L7GWQ9_9ACTN|nr:Fic family protein [Gordonia mangrovi]MXP24360.1 Fic family protein [Gordonia mangrovi]UVF80037.1 Fic family protein [Gordonia mangrovi]
MPSLSADNRSQNPWPAVSSEVVEWSPTTPADLLTRAQRERYRGPYRAALVPHIADLTPHVSPETSALVAEASSVITRFDAELRNELAPFSAILLRSESASSSQIENLSSGAKQVALAELGSRAERNATEIVGNVAATTAAIELADRLDTNAILAMHRALMEDTSPQMAGRWREDQVWIGGTSIGPHDADFVAPTPAHVPGLMDDLIAFSRRADVSPLIHVAVAHAQFETIHPFPDGNGRTGRALVQAMLRASRLTQNVTVPVSAGLLADTNSYFAALDAYRTGDPSPVVETFSYAALSAVDNGRRLVSDLRRIRELWGERVRARRGSGAQKLMDLLLRQPVVDRRATAAALGISPDNAGRAIDPLVEAGILREFTGFARNRMWQATEVADALDEFAARSVRRGHG